MKLLKFFTITLAQLIALNSIANPCANLAQDDTVFVSEITSSPVFDGIGSDACWQNLSWQSIDQIWIPWGTTMEASDFSARYKVAWSSAENVLYFLLEITDDVVSDAYVPGETAAIYNFDMFEVFIDEDKSGGFHVFDGTADNEASLGLNAENAFAYHIFTGFPESGETTDTFRVEDTGGNNWGNAITKIYNAHFPNFVLHKLDNLNTWEFSLMVYDDTYSDENVEGSRVSLSVGKVLGLSIAYNDDDEPEVDPSMVTRDNFIGSVAVTELAYNDHWKNANDFGALKLIEGSTSIETNQMNNRSPINIYPNPAENEFTIQVLDDYRGEVEIILYNCQGKELMSVCGNKQYDLFSEHLKHNYQAGLYFVQLNFGDNLYCRPLSFTN